MNKSVLLDANVLMELLFCRAKAGLCQEKMQKYESFYITPTSLHIVFYYAEKYDYDLALAEEFLDQFYLLDFNLEVYRLARSIYKQSEMEDALQVASAIFRQVSTLLTLDKKLFKKYKDLLTVDLT